MAVTFYCLVIVVLICLLFGIRNNENRNVLQISNPFNQFAKMLGNALSPDQAPRKENGKLYLVPMYMSMLIILRVLILIGIQYSHSSL